MEQATRNKLRNVVTQCRKLLEESIAQQLEGQFGIRAGKKDAVQIEDEARMSHLSEEDQHYRRDLIDHLEHIKVLSFKPKDALDQLIREIAFTHLNRLCAYKMMEARDVYVGGQRFREAVGRGINSNGFKFYLADHPDDERLFNTGNQETAYRHFLDWLGGTLSGEIGVLFSPSDPANQLYPRQKKLDELLVLLNDEELSDIWQQDETIGWVYQYFTPSELRDQARKESQAPRNSYELAFRNQFFTPRYVVEFLTDNTLGRIWYEMLRGKTNLTDQCRSMVRRQNEVFLDEGQEPIRQKEGVPSQEKLLQQPIHISHRAKKDPRELKILDPACGSGHFLLYCFDLLLTIYEEAYNDPDLGPALQKDYLSLDDLRRDVPRLILDRNLHGIDIDLRASQIAALALWLRCQRTYQEMGLQKNRPTITRSHLVCAEPMPGEEQMLKEFVGQLEPKLLGQLVEVVFSKMKLAGEAGALLKIEEEIRDAVSVAKQQWLAGSVVVQRSLFDEEKPKITQHQFDVSGISDDEFFQQAETKVVETLRAYAEQSQNGNRLQRELFADDAMRGFAFVDICRTTCDVVLMNPPFGKGSTHSDKFLRKAYPDNWKDLYAAFFERAMSLAPKGMVGAITSSQFLYTKQLRQLRSSFVTQGALSVFIKLGHGVLDGAAVDTGLSVLTLSDRATDDLAYTDVSSSAPECRNFKLEAKVSAAELDTFRLGDFGHVATSPFAFHSDPRLLSLWKDENRLEPSVARVATGNHTFDDERFVRLRWEVPLKAIGERWKLFEKGGEYQPFLSATPLVLDWDNDGYELRALNTSKYGSDAQVMQSSKYWYKPGLCYSHVSSVAFGPRIMPAGEIFSSESIAIIPTSQQHVWPLLGLLCSTLFQDLVYVFGEYRKIENRAVSNLPISPETLNLDSEQLGQLARQSVFLMAKLESLDETSALFVLPDAVTSAQVGGNTVRKRIRDDLAVLCDELDSTAIRLMFGDMPLPTLRARSRSEIVDVYVSRFVANDKDVAATLVSYGVGAILGRWNPTARSVQPEERDPFDKLPRCSPGMLQGPDDLPASETPEGHPIRIDWDGILVDDADHPDDIVGRVRELLELIWKDCVESIEKEASGLLGVKTLRDYFRKPGKGGFWGDHVKRYSESRRKAPIYWLLQSSKKNYGLWLYYHRLEKDMLFKALVNYVEPKIQQEENRIAEIRSQKSSAGESGSVSKKLDREIEKQEDLLSELRDFEEKLRKVADLHLVPDLNDGVVLNIAPLHELVPWKEAKKYWDQLMDGKHEWSSIGKQLREKGLVK
jgi:hypothetical protein